MSRSSSPTKEKTKAKGKGPVTGHAAEDPMTVGFYWGERADAKGKTPEDFLPNKEGYRKGLKYKPSGVRAFNLQDGVPRNCTLPPLAIWTEGEWLNEILASRLHYRLKDVDDDVAYSLWVVDGAGQPGNWELIAYYLPDNIASEPLPKHPRDWPEKQRQFIEPYKAKDIPSLPVGMNPVGSTTTGSSFWHDEPKKKTQVVVPTTQAPSLPAGVRIRCPGCGHWFKEGDLSGHAMVCPTMNEGSNDWAIMCVAECGCRTLDEVATPKPGFPRPKPEAKTEEEVKPVSETIEEPPEEETPEETPTDTPEEEVAEETEG